MALNFYRWTKAVWTAWRRSKPEVADRKELENTPLAAPLDSPVPAQPASGNIFGLPDSALSNSDDDQLYSIGEACAYLGISRNTLAYLRQAGYLKSYYNGRNVRFRKGDLRLLKLWYEQQKHKKRSS